MSRINNTVSVRRRVLRTSLLAVTMFALCFFAEVNNAAAQVVNEGFEDLELILTSGDWFTVNHSDPINPDIDGWGQCGGTAIPPAHEGTPNSCALVNFQSGVGTSTMNNWLIGPTRTFNNGDLISFWTHTVLGSAFPDRLQLRLSTNGSSTNVGTGAFDVGDFTTLLVDINPDYNIGGYPEFWEKFTGTVSGLAGPTSGRFAFRYFVENGGPTGSNANIIGVDTVRTASAQHIADFNGDGRTDPAVTRVTNSPGAGQLRWFIDQSAPLIDGGDGGSGSVEEDWGLDGDTVVPLDYDGDQKSDIAVWQALPTAPAFFYILQSQTGTLRQEQFGQVGDDATVTSDYTGDGNADPAIFRAATGEWWYLASDGPLSGQQVVTRWGQPGDTPAPGDYNGDGKADFLIRRVDESSPTQARFFYRPGTGGGDPGGEGTTVQFGVVTDEIVPGDYTADGKTDIAVVRTVAGALHWFVLPSEGGAASSSPYAIFGNAGDVTAQGDYDGDGSTDVAIWRANADPTQNFFYYLGTTSFESQIEWGQSGDRPVAHFNSH